jgi:hypothetical protein
MEVGALTSEGVYPLHCQTLEQQDLEAEALPDDPSPSAEVSQTSAAPAESADQDRKDGECVKGVLRLLEEGHFKGVADVRLRINFHEELAEMEHQRLQEVTEQEVDSVLESVATVLESGEFMEEQVATVEQFQKEFVNSVMELKGEFVAADEPDKEGLIAGLENMFEALIESLSTALVAGVAEAQGEDNLIPEEDGAEDSAPVTPLTEDDEPAFATPPVPEVKSDFQTLIENVRAAFEAALEQIVTSLNEFDILPELSEPTGKGVAYQKFLAMYNEVWNIDNRQGVLDGGEPFSEIV